MRAPRINTAHYHGGEPIRIIRPFLEGEEKKPYFLAMTAAGQSALNVQGLDTVVIDDTRFSNVIERGKNVLTKLHLGANEILQMAGRVHGRVGGRARVHPQRPRHRLRVAQADGAGVPARRRLGARRDDVRGSRRRRRPARAAGAARQGRVSPRDAVSRGRGIIEKGRLTRYGRAVEAMPVEREWAELLVNADDAMVPYLAVMSGVESLHRMTREERDLDGLIVPGSDHLTAYNVYAEAYKVAGYVGEVYGSAAPSLQRRGDRPSGPSGAACS